MGEGKDLLHSVIDYNNARHSRESGNPEKHWIPPYQVRGRLSQARNDKRHRTCVAMDKTRILKMEASDLDTVAETDASSRLTPWSKESFLEELKNPLSSCFTLKLKKGATEQVIGFICFRILGEESELLDLAIHSRYRQRGFGKHLMTFYLDFCHERRVKTFYLETGVSNQSAIRLYQSFAYQPIGKRPKFYQGREDALLMMRRA